VLFVYFGLFSLWSFYHKLYVYGHELDPTAAVKVPPFTPPVFGHTTMANFEVYSYPDVGSYCMAVVPLALFAAMWLSRKAHVEKG
jgi:copper chaperone NosL